MRSMTTREQRRNFGVRIRELRAARSWSQHDLAAQLEVTDATVAKWERGGGATEANVLALESIFGLEAGTLGSKLGQAPHPAMPSPEDAIAASGLPVDYQRTLLAHLAEIRRLVAEGE